MARYRNQLPQLDTGLFVTDGGLETTLIFHQGIELPLFAAFDLLKHDAGRTLLADYFRRYAEIARAHGFGLVLESPTWRANQDWGAKLGYDRQALEKANRQAIDLMLAVRAAHEDARTDARPNPRTKVVISGNLGPRGDGYRPASRMSAREAQAYHTAQIRTFAQTEADMVAGFTMNYVEEAIGIAAAAQACGIPAAISFTLETDGRLPSGDTLASAIRRTDDETGGYPAYYMLNCAHPTHFASVLQEDAPWRSRLLGLRANASKRSHAELDESPDLDAGDPEELGAQYRELHAVLPCLRVIGGCCGTDHRHVEAACRALRLRELSPLSDA